ncbi:unnamed protein product [Prunus armeniaca]
MLRIAAGFPVWNFVAEALPVVALILLPYFLREAITRSSSKGIWKYIIMGTNLSYMLIAVHRASESDRLNMAWVLKGTGRSYFPRLIYAIGFGQLLLLTFNQLFSKGKSSDQSNLLYIKTVAMFSAWSSTIIILLGKQGPWVALAFIIGGYCIMRLDNPQLYALGAGTWNFEDSVGTYQNKSKLEEWMLNYANVLCTNSRQVKRYIDIYSASSIIGFSNEDLLHIASMYAKAEEKWMHTTQKLLLHKKESHNELLPALRRQIDLYSEFLASVAELACSKWTEFNLKMMGTGLGIMLISLLIHFLAIKNVKEQYGFSFTSSGDSGISFGLIFSCFMVVIRACSFLSNSFICNLRAVEEGKVACFLLATTALVKMRYSIMKKKMILEAFVFLLLITICRFTIEVGLSKQAPSSEFVNAYPSWMLGIAAGFPIWNFVAEALLVVALLLLAFLLREAITGSSSKGIWKYIIMGTNLSYIPIAVHWASESDRLNLAWVLKGTGRSYIPRLIYAIGFGQLLLLTFNQLFSKRKSSDHSNLLYIKTVAMFSAWSSTIIILLGRQGPWVVLAFIIGGQCIMRLDNIELDVKDGGSWNRMLDPVPVTQWSLFAVCLFFCTGHWCAFDGLRYGAAFIG